MHTHKLPAHRDAVISDYGKYFGLYLVLITGFAQQSISLITLHVGVFYMICKKNFIFRPKITDFFCTFMYRLVNCNPHYRIILVHFLFSQK